MARSYSLYTCVEQTGVQEHGAIFVWRAVLTVREEYLLFLKIENCFNTFAASYLNTQGR
jgi:hypothetical protein